MTLDLEPRDRSRLLAAAILLAVFMAGIFGGATLFFLFRSDGHPRMVTREKIVAGPGMLGGPGGPGGGDVVFMRGPGPIFGELGLDPPQQERVDRLMQEQQQKAEQLMSEMEPRMKALMDSTNAAIEEVLTPEQRERFRQMQEHRREMIVRRFNVPAAPPEPGD